MLWLSEPARGRRADKGTMKEVSSNAEQVLRASDDKVADELPDRQSIEQIPPPTTQPLVPSPLRCLDKPPQQTTRVLAGCALVGRFGRPRGQRGRSLRGNS